MSKATHTKNSEPQAFVTHAHWPAVREAVAKLKAAGFQALLAGGCVRDLLMNREPNDFDIATDATPDQASELFPNALLVGKAFGVTIIPQNGFQLEIATFRVDLEYKDGRRPEGVRFATPQEDAERRDFTINALFYDLEKMEVIDYVEGQKDIQLEVIRTVGDPAKRFGEDKLRILRAVRFAAQLRFGIVPSTMKAIVELAPEIRLVSRERVRDELTKLFKTHHRAKGMSLLQSTGLLTALFPAVAEKADGDWLRNFEKLDADDSEKDTTEAFALFFLPIFTSDKSFRSELTNAKLDGQQVDAIMFALKNLVYFQNPDSIREGELVALLAAPAAASTERLARLLEVDTDSAHAAAAARAKLRNRSLPGGTLPQAFVTGEDAKSMGIKPGPEMGKTLREVFLLQLEAKFASRDEALAWLKRAL